MKKFEKLGRTLSKYEKRAIMGGNPPEDDEGGGGSCCAHTAACGGPEIWCCGLDKYGAQNQATIFALLCGQGYWCCASCQGHASSNCG